MGNITRSLRVEGREYTRVSCQNSCEMFMCLLSGAMIRVRIWMP